jgi:hypothetical protein
MSTRIDKILASAEMTNLIVSHFEAADVQELDDFMARTALRMAATEEEGAVKRILRKLQFWKGRQS